MSRRALILAPLLLALVGAAPVPAGADHWRRLVSPHDQAHLKNWRRTWLEALEQVRAAGFGAQVTAEGALLQPDAALEKPTAPDGAYRCRMLKLGRPVVAAPAPAPLYRVMPEVPCTIAGSIFRTATGAQRPDGTFHPDTELRLAFLGAMMLGDESGVGRYGWDDERSLAGFLERYATTRWRLVLPEPSWEAHMIVIEITPAAPG